MKTIPRLSKNKSFDLEKFFAEELNESKALKISMYCVGSVLGLFALGFVFKAANYTAHNFKNLSATLKR